MQKWFDLERMGADATTIGVRVARAVTGRDHIAYCGYHGWHDWFIGDTDLNSGIPDFNKEIIPFI